jgi:hypothetical protein
MEASYREGSGWKANEVMDVCHVGEWYKNPSGKHIQNNVQLSQTVSSALNRFPLKFACQASVSGAFQTQLEDGIIGLEYSKASLWQQMYNFGAIQRQAFALCFGRSLTHSSLAGIFTVGGVDPQFHNSPMVYAKATGIKSEYFSVTVRKVYLREGGGGNSALSKNPNTRTFLLDISEEDLNYEEVIIDSGATDTYFTKKLEKPFQQVWTQITGRKFDKSYTPTLTKEQVDSFPTMIFQLHGVKEYNRQHTKRHIGTIVGLAANLDPGHPFDVLVAVPPSHYLEYSAKKDRFVSRFHFDPNYDSAFGSSTLIGHNVYVDIDNNRIGWAESSCDYAALVGKFPTDKAAANGGSDDREDFGSDNSKPDDVDKGQSEGDDDNSKSVGVDAKEDSLSDEDANDDDDGILHHNTRTDDHNDIDKADKNEKEERQPSLVTTDDLSHVFLSTSRFSNRTQGTVGDPTLVTSVVRTLSTFWYRRFAVSLLLFFVVLLTCGVLQWLRRKRCRGSRCFSRATTPPSSPRSPSLEDVSPSRTTLRLGKVTRRNRG